MAFNAYPSPPNDPASFAGYHSGQGVPGAADAGLLHALAQANHFTLEDVQVNRQGWLSPRQREEAQSSPLLWFCVALIIVGGAIVGGVWDLFGLPPKGLNWFMALALVLAWLGLSALIAFLGVRYTRKEVGDGRVAFLDGVVKRVRHQDVINGVQYAASYAYVVDPPQPNAVNQQRFSVNEAAFHALLPGRRYRVYYMPASNKLVSIEPLP